MDRAGTSAKARFSVAATPRNSLLEEMMTLRAAPFAKSGGTSKPSQATTTFS